MFTSVNRNDLESLEVVIPSSLDYRMRISNILSTIDRKIELNKQLNDYLYACCLTKMQEVVSKASELIYSGGTPSTNNPEYWGGDLSWLSSGETHSRFIIDTEKK